jgi:hypothetical protein
LSASNNDSERKKSGKALRQQLVCNSDDPPLSIHEWMSSHTLSKDQSISFANDLVAKRNGGLGQRGNAGFDSQKIIVVRAMPILAMALGDWQIYAMEVFPISITLAQRSQQFCSADFEPDKVIRVIGNTHPVCLGVSHAHLWRVPASEFGEVSFGAHRFTFCNLGIMT